MENRILARLRRQLGAGEAGDPLGPLTLLSVVDLTTYAMEAWNEGRSDGLRRALLCPCL